jgi:tetratricopeptide (TPR) repeat protein
MADASYHFTLPLVEFDASLLSADAPKPSHEDYSAAVHDFLRRQFGGFSGDAKIIVSGETISVEWGPASKSETPVSAAIAKLTAGNLVQGIVMLELWRGQHPEDAQVLYNLGAAYSDLGHLDRAVACLEKALSLKPGHVNARIALAVARGRQGKNDEAIPLLERAVADDPQNPWAHRNLGFCLLKAGQSERASVCLQRATQLAPKDQAAFLGLAQAYRAQGRVKDADAAYRDVRKIDEFSDLAEEAERGLSSLAEERFRSPLGEIPRPDAVDYCRGALEKFAKMPVAQIHQVVYEIALLGSGGLKINDSTRKYHVRSLPGEFTALQLVSYMYVGMKQVAPGEDAGIDLSKEYAIAKAMVQDT